MMRFPVDIELLQANNLSLYGRWCPGGVGQPSRNLPFTTDGLWLRQLRFARRGL